MVTPKSGFTDGWLKIKATLNGDEGYCDYAYVRVGDFIDIGGTVLWARSNLTGSSHSVSLCSYSYNGGSYYRWGSLTKCNDNGEGVTEANCPKWTSAGETGSWSGTGQLKYGGKYNETDKKTSLDDADDVAYQSSASKASGRWYIPTRNQALELLDVSGGTAINATTQTVSNRVYVVYTSKYKYFDDVSVGFTFTGTLVPQYPYHASSDMHHMTRTLMQENGDTSIPDWKGNTTPQTGYTAPYTISYCENGGVGVLRRYNGWCIRPVCKPTTSIYPSGTITASNP